MQISASEPAASVSGRPYRRDLSIVMAFAEVASATPEAVALRCADRTLSYGELDLASNRLARRLAAVGVRSGHRVALLAERSKETIVAILAILKAGAAYVPLDPSYPVEQLAFMTTDCEPSLVICQATPDPSLVAALPKCELRTLADLLREAAELDASAVPCAAGGGDPAYVMYTSGSTGKPKGAVVPHRAVTRLVREQNFMSFAPDEVFLHLAPLAFDASTLEIWGPLLNGGQIAIVPQVRPTLDQIASAIETYRPTAAWFTAGLFHLLVEYKLEQLRPLKQILAGGDVLSPTHIRRALDALPDSTLINGYGPTENTTFSCCFRIAREGWGEGPVPIGLPIAHTTVRILDDRMEDVRQGDIGQLAVAGDGLADGYLNRPELTRERFVTDAGGGRMYLTGDLVRARADGIIEFIGRADTQVKIDGKRVELTEIETRLREDASVADAVVVARPQGAGKALVAYLKPNKAGAIADPALVLQALKSKLPSHMVPARVVVLDEFPLTPNGKINRAALPDPFARVERTQTEAGRTDALVREVWEAVLGVNSVGTSENFFDLGGTSLRLLEVHERLSRELKREIDIVSLFEYPTIGALAKFLDHGKGPQSGAEARGRRTAPTTPSKTTAIAIVGLSGRFPGARNVRELWTVLREGRMCISRFAPEELEDAFGDDVRSSPGYVPARSVLADVDQFDADFFAMRAREAALTDPQHRVFLECCWEALEDAGHDPAKYKGAIGVFAGSSYNSYLIKHVLADRRAVDEYTSNFQVGSYEELVGSLQDVLATRVAYKLNLKGPAVNVQSACSTSLLAVAQACQSLLLFQSDMALAGGVSISFPQKRGYVSLEGGMVSPDGLCRPFDADASGTVFGSGAGVVVLKRLDDALADKDTIYAVIRGFGVNNDGAGKVGFTAPSVDGQAEVIAAALGMADVDPDSIGYVECHGTATPLGDPIEFKGLVKAFAASQKRNHCVLGSAKGNLGHLDAAAGVTGLIKAALALKHAEIPPLVNFKASNPNIDVAASPFKFSAELTKWQAEGPRRAGVSAFGVGGTNVHVVLEEAPHTDRKPLAERAPQVLSLSARNAESVSNAAAGLADHLEATPNLALADVAATLFERRAFDCRAGIAAATTADAVAKLRALAPSNIRTRANEPYVVFMFPGQGAQYPGMGQGLYDAEPTFRRHVDAGAALFKSLTGTDLLALLYADVPAGDDTPHPIRSTVLAQPALFIVEHALAQLLLARGIAPAAMIGHSLGEFVAACLAGVMSFEDALKLVAARGRLMQEQPPGAMLSVRASEERLKALCGDGAEIAAVNAPQLSVVSGPFDAIAALEAKLDAAEISHRRLHTSHAFHSAMMDDVVEALKREAARVRLQAPTRPYVSAVTGTWARAEDAASPDYWARHCREPVRFAPALATLLERKDLVLLEVGPGRTLTTFAGQAKSKANVRAAIATLPEFAARGEARSTFAEALGALWCEGAPVEWSKIKDPEARRVPLPTYPFARKRHWIEAPKPERGDAAPVAAAEPIPAPETAPTVIEQTPSETIMTDRQALLRNDIQKLLEELSGESLEGANHAATFLELGFDSLFLGQVVKRLQKNYGVKIAFRQLLSEYPSIEVLADHLMKTAKPETLPAASAPAPAAAPTKTVAQTSAAATPVAPLPMQLMALPPTGSSGIENVLQHQLTAMQQLIAQQLQTLQTIAGAPAPAMIAPSPQPATGQTSASAKPAAPEIKFEEATPSRFAMYKPGAKSNIDGMTPAQRRFVDDLVARYAKKSPGSKQRTQDARAVLADPRSAAGFRAEWKEMVFPIVSPRSKGSKIWDVDGNEYVDLVNGFGQTMFGHAPDFVVEAIAEQAKQGFAIGPQSPLAGEVANIFAELTGNERVTFCNTGSEAVMAAIRVARTVTGREKVVVFGGAYHGQFDEVLVKPAAKGNAGALPVAPGIPQESVDNMIVLPYATPESLAWVRANADDLAAVIAETVQSRHPNLRPREFLAELREITAASGTALVFDEVVTGFRVHPGGMQAVFGIRADMATYGKVVGGGMPVGVLAGKAEFMDALDGGFWRFGDDSVPETAPTFFAGTFVRHPLTLAACRAVLLHLKQSGPKLQEAVAAKTARMAEEMNAYLAERGVKTRLETFSSWCYANFSAEDPLASLFYAHMRLLGVNLLEGFPWFVTTAHTDADLAKVLDAFKKSIDALQSAGILAPGDKPDLPSSGPNGSDAAPRNGASKSALHTGANGSGARAQDGVIEVPLTEEQKEVWLAAQLSDGASCAYNEGTTVAFEGELDVDALRAAFNGVVARHEALRATVSRLGDHLRIAPALKLDIPLIEIGGAPDADARFAAILDEEARTPFDLANGPLLRVRLVRRAPARHALVITAHHLVCDGWSFGVILSELAELYRARVEGAEPELGDVLPFHRYAADRNAPKAEAADVEAFWLNEYKDLPAPLELPSDRARPRAKTFRGATYTEHLDADLIAAVKKAGAKSGTTLFATLFAATQVVLGKLAGQDDIALTVPMAGQTLIEDEVLVGHCVNFLPVRQRFDPSAPFATHLTNVKAKVMAALDHQTYTYGTLVDRLGLKRDPNRTPITDVQFNMEKFGTGIEFPGLTTAIVSNPKAFVVFDLFLNMTESPTGVRVDVDYSTDLYDRTTISRWVGHLRAALRALADDPARSIADLAILSDADRRHLIEDLNATAADYPKDVLIHELIETQAARTPDAIALRFQDQTVTYRDLDARAARLARRFAALLPGGGRRIAVALPRSIDLIATLIAVLKSGNAYVPLDPTHPAARLGQTLAAADVSALVCAEDDIAVLAPSGVDILRLDRPAPVEPETLDLPRPREGASAPAYVIFTSGSTGTPKGVEIEHRAVVNFLLSMAKAPGFTAKDTIVAVTTVSFDIAGLEMYLPLVTGGRAVIASREQVKDGFTLAEMINASGATIVQATPSLWRMLIEAGLKAGPHLKMLCGGEPLPRDLANKLASTGGELWNVYGPTETTIWSSAGRVEAGSGPITIGAPIANTEIHILDNNDELAPIGAVGDVYIGGDGLARGYFNRPDLTAAAFRTMDLGDGVARRLYRTGDVGRRLANGAIQLQGRKDHQVKLRGYRIELEDIESNLRRLPGIADAAAAVQGAGEADARLVGYYVAADGRDMQPPALLQRQLGEKLPDYMVPTLWQRLDRMPQTANGKLDRKALPLVRTAPQLKVVAQTARTLTAAEESVAKLWRELLETNEIAPDTHFFEAGGHSLLAMRLIARLRTEMNRPVTIADLFRSPRLAEFAKAVAGADETEGEADKIVHIQGGSRPPLIFINNAWNLFPLAKALGPDQPVISIQFVDRTIEEPRPQIAWEAVVDEAVSLIRKAKPKGDYILAGHCVLGAVAFEAARRLKAEGEAVRLVALMDTEQNLKLVGVPLGAKVYNWLALQVRNVRWHADQWARGQVNLLHILARYASPQRLGLVALMRRLGFKERWDSSDFHTQHVVDAWMSRVSAPYQGRVVLYKVQPGERPGFFDRWLPLTGWQAIVGERLAERTIRTHHATFFESDTIGDVGADLRQQIDGAVEPEEDPQRSQEGLKATAAAGQ